MFRRLSLVLVTAIVVVLATAHYWLEQHLARPLTFEGESRVLTVSSGSSLSVLARQLAAEGLVDSPYPLLIHGRLAGLKTIKAGEYRIPAGQTPRRLLERLVAGDVIQYRITFPEGRTLSQWLARLNAHERLGEGPPLTLQALRQHFTPPAGESLEGWFFPDTYRFDARSGKLDILIRAHRAMRETLEREWAQRSDDLPLETPYEALILASIVERETGLAGERAAIAGVFVRRLQRGMRLQTDPTVIYGLGERYSGNLTRDHLREKNPYNTYRVGGLPPTPIANPGRAAIRAALNPAPGEALYFVARGDGSHHFSTTLKEHREAVRRYQLNPAEDYRSSPD